MQNQTMQFPKAQIKPLVSPDTGKVELYDLLSRIDDLAFDAEKLDTLSDEVIQHTPFKYGVEQINSTSLAREELLIDFNRMQLLLYAQQDYISNLKRGLAELRCIEYDMVIVPVQAEQESLDWINEAFDAYAYIGELRQLILAVYQLHFTQREDAFNDTSSLYEIKLTYPMAKAIVSSALDKVRNIETILKGIQENALSEKAKGPLASSPSKVAM